MEKQEINKELPMRKPLVKKPVPRQTDNSKMVLKKIL
jgi:hypothetical protein